MPHPVHDLMNRRRWIYLVRVACEVSVEHVVVRCSRNEACCCSNMHVLTGRCCVHSHVGNCRDERVNIVLSAWDALAYGGGCSGDKAGDSGGIGC